MPHFSYPPNSLLIVGASARAAAQSANSSGYECFAVDMFADVDTRQFCADAVQVDRLEQALQVAERFPADSFMYTGCVENRALLIKRLSEKFALAGNDSEVIEKVRDPFWLQRIASENDFHFPKTFSIADAVQMSGGKWLLKPIASGSGWGIESFLPGLPRNMGTRSSCIVQEEIAGEPYSAAFVSNYKGTSLIGVSRQLHNTHGNDSERFHYRGSIGPFDLPPALTNELKRIGGVISSGARMRGLFGIDFLLSGDCIHLIEINPRYTASMELFEERATVSIVDLHLKACAGMPVELQEDSSDKFRCKLIHFSRQDDSFVVSEDFGPWTANLSASNGMIRDIPKVGLRIKPGQPVFTCIASGASTDEALVACQQLADKAVQVAMGNERSSK